MTAVGAASAEQFVEQQAECMHVGRRGRLVATDLLGGSIGGCEQARARFGGEGLRVFLVELLGDAEVEQLDGAAAIDEDVARLDVAVDDGMTVRVFDRCAEIEQ